MGISVVDDFVNQVNKRSYDNQSEQAAVFLGGKKYIPFLFPTPILRKTF